MVKNGLNNYVSVIVEEMQVQRNNPFASTMRHLKTLHIGRKGITRLQERVMKLFLGKVI